MKKITQKLNHIFDSAFRETFDALSLLILRIMGGGFMLYGHGWDKASNFSTIAPNFPDPLGLGNSTLSLSMAVFGEVVCAGLLLMGALTRLAAVPAMITMAVAAFIVHAADPFKQKEMALMYLGIYIVIFFKGAGAYSVDAIAKKL